MAEKAYGLGRQMGWSSVSRQYLETFADVMKPAVKLRSAAEKVHAL